MSRSVAWGGGGAVAVVAVAGGADGGGGGVATVAVAGGCVGISLESQSASAGAPARTHDYFYALPQDSDK